MDWEFEVVKEMQGLSQAFNNPCIGTLASSAKNKVMTLIFLIPVT